MSKVARFTSTGPGHDAYARKTLSGSTAFTVRLVVVVDDDTISSNSDVLEMGGDHGSGNSAETWPDETGWGTQASPNGPVPAAGRDTVIEKTATYVSGTSWDVTTSVDGTALDPDAGVDFGIGPSDPFIVDAGLIFAAAATVYVKSIEVRDAASTVVFSDAFASGDFSAWDSSTGDATVEEYSLVVKLYDLASTELADITAIAFEPSLEVDMEHCGPWQFTLTCPAGHSLLTAAAGDGYPNLRKLNRKLIVWEKGTVIFHGRVFIVDRVGDGRENLVKITAWSPWMELGFDADDRAGRPVRDATGNFINPSFTSSVPGQDEISGPDLVKQVLTNSQGTDSEAGPNPGEGPLPIALTGDFDLDVPPAVDLSPLDSMDWPVLCGDFITQLVESGVCDVYMRPVDPAEGLDSYVMVELSAVSSYGTDRSATVHFDYWTGAKNAAEAEHVESGETLCNKLYDYLGPRIDQSHWRGNITPGSPGVTIDPTDSRALYGGPGTDKGTFMQIRIYDSVGDESASRPLYLALFNAELGYRVEPRDLLYITPAKGSAALFDALHDFNVGDTVTQNVGAALGVTLAAAQRVFGFTKSWDRQFVPTVSRLMTSADVSLGG